MSLFDPVFRLCASELLTASSDNGELDAFNLHGLTWFHPSEAAANTMAREMNALQATKRSVEDEELGMGSPCCVLGRCVLFIEFQNMSTVNCHYSQFNFECFRSRGRPLASTLYFKDCVVSSTMESRLVRDTSTFCRLLGLLGPRSNDGGLYVSFHKVHEPSACVAERHTHRARGLRIKASGERVLVLVGMQDRLLALLLSPPAADDDIQGYIDPYFVTEAKAVLLRLEAEGIFETVKADMQHRASRIMSVGPTKSKGSERLLLHYLVADRLKVSRESCIAL